MQHKQLTIVNKLGLHARAAAKLVHCASRFLCEIMITRGDKTVNGKSIMGVMMLAASQGTTIELAIEGQDEQQAMTALTDLIDSGFGEPS